MIALVRILGWLLGLVYATIPSFWLLVHPWTGFWSRRRSPYRLLLPLWFLLIAVAAIVTWRWRNSTLYHTGLSWIPALTLFVIGIAIYRGTRPHFKREQMIGRAELQPQSHRQQLVTSGIHGRVRHPVYLAHFCMLLGWAVGTGLGVLYALSVFALLTGIAMVLVEERELERRFGEDFRSYKQRVPAVIPRFGNVQPASAER